MQKISLISLLAVLCTGNIGSAQNLVPNPSFELYNSIYCGIMGNNVFNQTTKNWVSPTNSSPDLYFTTISPSCYNFQNNSQYTGPIGIKGSQFPRTGTVMAGCWLYTIPGLNQREYVQVQLTTPMVVGTSYVVSFYVSLADNMEKSTRNIGAYLSANPVSGSSSNPLPYQPQVEADNFITEVSDWVLITDTVVALEHYEYLTIGNFYDDQTTATQPNPGYSGQPGTYGAYYFIDDVSVVQVGTSPTVSVDAEAVQIYPNPTADKLRIQLPEAYPVVRVQLFDVIGASLFSQRYTTQDLLELDVSQLPNGTYFLRLDMSGQTLVKVFQKTPGE